MIVIFAAVTVAAVGAAVAFVEPAFAAVRAMVAAVRAMVAAVIMYLCSCGGSSADGGGVDERS